MKRLLISGLVALVMFLSLAGTAAAVSDPNGSPRAHTTWHLKPGAVTSIPTGLSPTQIRGAYGLPSTGGSGTIAIIDAYDNPNAQNDLDVFSTQFGLPLTSTGYFTKYKMSSSVPADTGWGLEIALDIQWAHAIAPEAKILLVEAASNSLSSLLGAVDYARGRSDVVAISMSWGANEFLSETSYDSHFTSSYGATFFASSGDSGSGIIWPAASPNVVAVGGTTLNLNPDGAVASETGWRGSGGGVSSRETEPAYQSTYGIPGANNHRGVPDVSYDADPNTGVSVYDSYGYGGWLVVGGTSAGAPQWAAIQSLGHSSSNPNFYKDAKSASYPSYFNDIITGSNGRYSATVGYDYVTGLGSPLTVNFAPTAAPDFSIAASPSPITAKPGDSPTSTITVTSLNNFNSPVSLSTSGTSWGINFNPASVTPSSGSPAMSIMTISVPSDATAGTYPITVTGTSGSLIHSTSLTVIVVAPDFSITASPSTRTVSRTGSTSYTVTLTALNGYSSPVNLSVTGLPSGWNASFSSSQVTPTVTGATSTLTVTIGQRHRGTYTLTITGTGTDASHITHSTKVTLSNK
jgi:subtilase family serine protease